MITGLIVRLRALLLRTHTDAELDEELQYHIARETERNVANGMTADEARHAAARAFGNTTIVTENAREAWRWRWVEELGQDVRFTLRSCRRAPTFALTVIATIGLGLGVLTTAFTVFDAYVLRPLEVRDAGQLYEVFGRGHSTAAFTWQRLQALRANRELADDALGYTFQSARVHGHTAFGQLVSGNYFDMLGVPPALGRTLTPADATPPSGEMVVVLSHRFWRAALGGDSSIVGQRVSVRGVSLTVVGIARERFAGLGSVPVDFWVPITASARLGGGDPFGARPAEMIQVIVRIRSGTTADQTARAIGDWLRRSTADLPTDDRIDGALLIPRGTPLPAVDEVYQLFAPIGAAFLLVLLIACANVANMMLARGFARQREIGVRLALGAGRVRLVRQLLTEAAVLAAPAALAGLAFSRVAIDACVRVIFATVPPAYAGHLRVIPFAADLRLALFVFATALVAAVAFGLVPALQTTRSDIVCASRGDFETELQPSRLRHALVATQVAFSVILLVSAGVLLGNASNVGSIDPGIRTRDVIQFEVSDSARIGVIQRLRGEARVESVASVHSAPLDGGWWVLPLRDAASKRDEAANVNLGSPEYFATVGLSLVRGRSFTTDEAVARAPVVIVSEAAAQRFWPGRDAIGQTLELTSPSTDSAVFGAFRSATVVGVVRNTIPGNIARPTTMPTVYYPQRLDAPGARLLARTHGDADDLLASLIASAGSSDSGAVEEAHSLQSSFALQVYPFRAAYWLAAALGCIALALTLSGVYGVVSYLVWQRRREFGIRLALGAATSSVVGLILRQSLRSASIGIGAGVAVTLGLSKLMAGSIILTHPFDPRGYAAGIAAVLVACLAAAYVPSRKAAAIDPASTLRADS